MDVPGCSEAVAFDNIKVITNTGTSIKGSIVTHRCVIRFVVGGMLVVSCYLLGVRK